MILSLILIEGKNVNRETLRSLQLGSAKQLVIGSADGFDALLHIAAESPADFSNAISKLAQIPGVTGLFTLAIRNS